MTQVPIATLKFRVSRAKTALDEAEQKLREAQSVVVGKKQALEEAERHLWEAEGRPLI